MTEELQEELQRVDIQPLVERLMGTEEKPGPFRSYYIHGREMVICVWRIGDEMLKFADTLSGDGESWGNYGDGIIFKTAGRLNIHRSTLYRAVEVRRRWDYEQFIYILDSGQVDGKGDRPTIANVKKLLLQDRRIGLPAVVQMDYLMTRVERTAAQLNRHIEELNQQYDVPGRPTSFLEDESIADVQKIVVETAREEVAVAGAIVESYREEPWRSRRYLSWVVSQFCSVCASTQDMVAHHIKPPGMPHKMSEKVDDCETIPLCAGHHNEFHQVGAKKWEGRHGVQIAHLAKVLARRVRETENQARD